MRNLGLAVHIVTKLNRSHLPIAKQSFILPCLGRTEIDIQAGGPQPVTVEDSMSMVHASRGDLKAASELLRSEPAIIAGMASATLPHTRVRWADLIADYRRIRDYIETAFPDFADFNARIRKPGGFRLYVAASERVADVDEESQFPGLSRTRRGSSRFESGSSRARDDQGP